MNKFDTSSTNSREEQEHRASSPSLQYRSPPTTGYDDRLIELEMENTRLNRLVAELLVKNQQLRKPD